MRKILFLMVGALLVIGLIGVGTFAIPQDVEAGTVEHEARFVFTNINISPSKVDIGQTVTVSVTATNAGEKGGSYELALEINGVVGASKKITLDIGDIEEVAFTISKDVAGTYSVAVEGLTGSFKVEEKSALAPSLIVGIIAAVVVVAVLVFFLVRRRAT